ncbi:hypothetical protein [Acetobacterium sp.]|uniref:hypothetical protein n=1 Tax=Acetobacterium sp. TaxID=1872094 RepID=UPI002F3F1118
MNNEIKIAAIITFGTFVFTGACIIIGGVVSGGASMGMAIAIGNIAAMCVALGIAFGKIVG